jgi:hypothetical protein
MLSRPIVAIAQDMPPWSIQGKGSCGGCGGRRYDGKGGQYVPGGYVSGEGVFYECPDECFRVYFARIMKYQQNIHKLKETVGFALHWKHIIHNHLQS